MRKGIMFVISAPSGCGKTTVTKALLERDPCLEISVSYTTRPPRSGERNNIEYHFIDTATFEKMVQEGKFIEHAKVFGHYYGTAKQPLWEALDAGRDVVLDIDWQGYNHLLEEQPLNIIGIYLLPSSIQTLAERLQKRQQDDADIIEARMEKAFEELEHWKEYEYTLINEDLESCILRVETIIQAERLKRTRQSHLNTFVANLLATRLKKE